VDRECIIGNTTLRERNIGCLEREKEAMLPSGKMVSIVCLLVAVIGISLGAATQNDDAKRYIETDHFTAVISERGLEKITVLGEEQPVISYFAWRWFRRGPEDEWPGTNQQPSSFALEAKSQDKVTLAQTYEDFDFLWTFSAAHSGEALKVDCVAVARRDFKSGEWGAQMPQMAVPNGRGVWYPSEQSAIAHLSLDEKQTIFPAEDWVAIERSPGQASLLVIGLTEQWHKRVRLYQLMFTCLDWPKEIKAGQEMRMSYLLVPYTGRVEKAVAQFVTDRAPTEIDLPGGFAFWPAHSLENIPLSVTKSRSRLEKAATRIKIWLCRGETEPFQVVFTPAADRVFTNLALSFSPLRAEGSGRMLPDNCLKWFRVKYYNDTYPDILQPTEQFDTVAGKTYNYPMWVRLTVPDDATPGLYSGWITLRSGEEMLHRLRLQVYIWDFTLPPKCQFNTALFGFWNNFITQHMGVEPDSEALKNILRAGCDSLAAHHIIHGNDGLGLVPWGADWKTEQGRQELLDWCEFWKSHGLRLGELRSYDEQFWRQYWPIFRQRGWGDEIYSAHWDEYATVQRAQEAVAVAQKLRQIAPGLRFMSTAIGGGSLAVHQAADPGTDIWATTPRIIELRRQFFEQKLADGEQVWPYIHHHIHLSAGAAATRTFFWQLSRMGMDGCCNWGLTAWGDAPFSETAVGLSQERTYMNYPPGDGVLYWPGSQQLLESCRLQRIRDGIEDWMYLEMLQAKLERARAVGEEDTDWMHQAIIALRLRDAMVQDRLIPGTEVYEHVTDPQAFEEIRMAVGEALEDAP